MTGTPLSEIRKRMRVAALTHDPAKTAEAQHVITSYFSGKGLDSRTLDMEGFRVHMHMLIQEARTDPRVSLDCVAIIEYLLDCLSPKQHQSDVSFKDYVITAERSLRTILGEGRQEHVEAAEAYLRRVKSPHDVLALLVDLVLISGAFTPRMRVEELLSGQEEIEIGSIDAAIPVLVEQPLWAGSVSGSASPEALLDAVENAQGAMGCVPLSMVCRLPEEEIIGSAAWMRRLLSSFGLRRTERRLIADLLETSAVGVWQDERLVAERLWRYLSWKVHFYGHAAFLAKTLLRGWNKSADRAFALIEKAGARKWRDLRLLWDLYHDLLGLLQIASETGWIDPLLQLGVGPDGVVVCAGQDLSAPTSRLSFYRHVLGGLAETLKRGQAASPIVCMGCHMTQGATRLPASPDKCVVGALFSAFAGNDDLLICCSGTRALFLRKPDLAAHDQAVAVPFSLRFRTPREVPGDAPSRAEGTPAVPAASWRARLLKFRRSSEEREHKRCSRVVDRVLSQLSSQFVALAHHLRERADEQQ
jgi:hypothetical protein